MQRLRDVVIICIAMSLTACMDSSADLVPDVDRGNAALETTAAQAAAACPTFAGTWETDATSFVAAIAPATQVDVSRRANGTLPTAALTVPRDEYLSCCGILLDYVGQAGGRLIWAGNPESGFSVKGKCPTRDECFAASGVRVTFVPATTAAGVFYSGGTTAAVFDPQNTQISTMRGTGRPTTFLGYRSAVPIDHAEIVDFLGEHLHKVIYRRCR